MPYRFYKSLAPLLGSLLLLLSFGAHAQNETWYRVEVLIFSNSGGGASELWEATPTLIYPEPLRFLVDSEHQSIVPTQGELTSTPFAPAVEGTPGSNEVSVSRSQLTPFVTLPATQLEFRGAAAQMQRSGRYRKLFHQAWTQPIGWKSGAKSILIDRSGDAGQWPALQGTIKLYVSRYLYLETNLWLNTSGEYLESSWRMPPPPLGPPTLDSVGQMTQPEYPYRHAVLLQQTRRMRSREVNYIDHPMFGVVVKVTPLAAAETGS